MKQTNEKENPAAGSLATGCDGVPNTGAHASAQWVKYPGTSLFASAVHVLPLLLLLLTGGGAFASGSDAGTTPNGFEQGTIAAVPSSTTSMLAVGMLCVSIVSLVWAVLLNRAMQRRINGFIPTAFRDDYHPGRIVRALIWCSGAHPSDLAPLSPGRHAAHAVSGLLLFAPAGMSWVGLRLWLSEFAPDAPVSQMIWSTVGAALVFGVDLGCVWMLNGLQGKNVLKGALPRVALALILGTVIAKGFVVVIYKDEVAQMQRDKKKAEVFDIANRSHEQREQFARQNQPVFERLRTQKTDVQRRVEALTPRRLEVQKRHDELHASYVTEVVHGQNGRGPKRGEFAIFLEGEMEKVRKELDAIAAEETMLKQEQKRLADEEAKEMARVVNDPNFAATRSAMDTVMTEAQMAEAKTIGRQLDLVREYVHAGGWDRRLEYWMWHLLFIFLDTIPITAKLFMRKKDVQMLQEQAEKRVEARVKAESVMAEQFETEKAQWRHEAELRRMKLMSFREEMGLLLQGAGDLILQTAQVEREVRATYDDIAGAAPRRSNVPERDWEQVLAPLHRVKSRVLTTFTSIIGEHTQPPKQNGHNVNGAHSMDDAGLN